MSTYDPTVTPEQRPGFVWNAGRSLGLMGPKAAKLVT